MLMALTAAAASSPARMWRTAFLTLRDESQAPATDNPLQLLNRTIFSQSDYILPAASELPPQEVASDIVLLLELALSISDSSDLDDVTHSFIHLSRFIHSTMPRVAFVMDPASVLLPVGCFRIALDIFIDRAKSSGEPSRIAAVVEAIKQCLDYVRLMSEVFQKTSLLSDCKQLLDFLHVVVAYFQVISSCSSSSVTEAKDKRAWDVHKTAFAIIGEVYSKVGHSLQVDVWQSTIEVLRQVMDLLASRGPLRDDSVMAKFYYSILHCFHLVLTDPKGSLSAHVSGFVAVLRMFLNYGIARSILPETVQGEELSSASKHLNMASASNSAPYRPPHLRKELKNMPMKDSEFISSAGLGSSTSYQTLSDSDCSDTEGSVRDLSTTLFDKTRLAAIVCIQDLCRADPKVFTTQWTLLLPLSDTLQPRKYEVNLMSCLLRDPYLKARLASAAAITGMLDTPASIFLKVAEFKDSTKLGSFTALSISLGQILMQLHSGTLYLIEHELHRGVLTASFKVLASLISSTPYSRMPAKLLPTVISCIHVKIEYMLSVWSDQTSILAAAIGCLTVALSASPPSDQVKAMLLEEVATGSFELRKESGILSMLFRCSEPLICPLICFESQQALRTLAHNYPSTMFSCWKQVSSNVLGFLRPTGDVPARLGKNIAGYSGGPSWEKVITSAIKVLDECLRAISGFRGTEDLSDDRLLECPFMYDHIRTKTISSAPLDGIQSHAAPGDGVDVCLLGREQWSEAINKHMRLCLRHSSGMVRAASVTCFAGLTSPVLISLTRAEQEFILSSCVDAALTDEVPSVRSAACRAIGVIACFPSVIHRGEAVNNLIYAAVHSSNDSLVSVRITASWALANICDSLRYCIDVPIFDSGFVESKGSQGLILVLIDSALRLSKDNDKIKANAVRALGNLCRFVPIPGLSGNCDEAVDAIFFPPINSSNRSLAKPQNFGGNSKSFHPSTPKASDWLGKMVQAFVSCITTGNVKVQWNVCHALSNLFLNKTLQLHDKEWAPAVFSILLLLLRDSANFKIRIQAAAALAVPITVNDYGTSFHDVLQGLVHVVGNLGSYQVSLPANLKYRVALEKQLTSTMLHVIGLASETEQQPMEEFLVKKAPFFEEWLGALCSSLGEFGIQLGGEQSAFLNEKKDVVSRALLSLIKVFEVGNHDAIARRFSKLLSGIV